MSKLHLVKSAAKEYSILNEPIKSQIKKHLNEFVSLGLNAKNIIPLTGELK